MATKFLLINQELYDKQKFVSHVLVPSGEHIFQYYVFEVYNIQFDLGNTSPRAAVYVLY